MTTQTLDHTYSASQTSAIGVYLARVFALFARNKSAASWADGAFCM